MILFLFGHDTFRSRQQLRKIMEKFKKDRDPEGLNVVRLDCATAKENILQHVLSVPFLAERRMVVLENLLVSKQPETQAEILTRVIEGTLPQETVMVLWEGTNMFKTAIAKKLFDVLKKEKFAQSFEELKGIALQKWIQQEIKERGGAREWVIAPVAVAYLSNNIGSDMWRLNGLLDQLLAYADNRAITLRDIQLFLEEKIDDNIFALVDGIVGGQSKYVFAMLQEQYRQGNDPGYVFAMVLRQFRILLELRDLVEREDSLKSDALAEKLSLHPFVVKKSLPLVKRYTKEALERVYEDLLDIDIKTKTGQGDQSLLLELFVSKVSAT